MKNNSKSITSFGKELDKSRFLAKLAKKNLKSGGSDTGIGCSPPIGGQN